METEETLPFPPPLLRPTTGERLALTTLKKRPSSPSLEQLTEARLAELRNEGYLWQTPAPRSGELVLASEKTDKQIVLASAQRAQAASLPLRWRGMAVSEELQLYASRVARGEDLAPYRGPILADPSQELPWDAADARALRKDTRRSVRLLLTLAGLGALVAFVLPANRAALLPEPAPASAVLELPPAATPQATPVESPALALEPLPALREPAPSPPAAAAARAANAPRAPGAPRSAALNTAPGAALPKAASTAHGRMAAAVTAGVAASLSSAAKRASEAHPGAQHAASPAAATEPSSLLLDRPSF
jgi:hypothetical protein